ncbi:hypothetical protein ACP70R_034800 [Stipagrostis hirtigluma subsp. patula]
MRYVMEVDLSRGAVAAMWRRADEGLQPVLQVAGVQRLPRRSPAAAAAVADGAVPPRALRRRPRAAGLSRHHIGPPRPGRRPPPRRRHPRPRVRLQPHPEPKVAKFIIVLRLEILQTERQLIGNPTIYEADATQPNILSSSGELDA